MPGVSIGIGVYLNFLEILANVAVVVNTAIAFFTSKRTKAYFMKEQYQLVAWEFLICIVAIEHIVFFCKFLLAQLMTESDDRF